MHICNVWAGRGWSLVRLPLYRAALILPPPPSVNGKTGDRAIGYPCLGQILGMQGKLELPRPKPRP